MSKKQDVYYVVFFETRYNSLEEALAKAPEVIAAHKVRSLELHNQGTLLMAGAFLDNAGEPLSTMVICPTREAAEEYAKGDPRSLQACSDWKPLKVRLRPVQRNRFMLSGFLMARH